MAHAPAPIPSVTRPNKSMLIDVALKQINKPTAAMLSPESTTALLPKASDKTPKTVKERKAPIV